LVSNSGLVGIAGDVLSLGGSLNYNSANVATANTISLTGLTSLKIASSLAGSQVSDYSITQASIPSVSGNITPAALTVYANSTGKFVGLADPALTYAVAGLQPVDALATILNGSLLRDKGEAIGKYLINAGSLKLLSTNYTLNYYPGYFTVSADPVSVMNALSGVAAMLPHPNTINIPAETPVVTNVMLADATSSSPSSIEDINSMPSTAASNGTSGASPAAQEAQKDEKSEEAGKVASANLASFRILDLTAAKPIPVCK
jgi:hypothetical protein